MNKPTPRIQESKTEGEVLKKKQGRDLDFRSTGIMEVVASERERERERAAVHRCGLLFIIYVCNWKDSTGVGVSRSARRVGLRSVGSLTRIPGKYTERERERERELDSR